MMDALNHLNLRYISLVEAEIKTGEIFVVDLEATRTGDVCSTIKILEVDIGITLMLEEILVIIIEVARDIGIITMIIEGTTLEVKVMIGIEVDY